MELVPKLGAEINSKYDCRKLAHCGAPIQNPHGPIFWCNFWNLVAGKTSVADGGFEDLVHEELLATMMQ